MFETLGMMGKNSCALVAAAAVLASTSCSNESQGETDSCGYSSNGAAAPCGLAPHACGKGPSTAPEVSEAVQVAPSELLPPQVQSMEAHNNLDIIWHDGRLFFAFRTAPSHFASPETRIYVVSSTDMKSWTFEAEFWLETDLREPRFLSMDGRLFLYMAVLGTRALLFEPKATIVSEYRGPCAWSETEEILEPGFIPWRIKMIDGKPYMMGYYGGEEIYGTDQAQIEVHWLTTTDGKTWTPVIPGKPVMLRGGASETDFTFAADGALIAVARNEAGDDMGFGSKICRAEPDDLGSWNCIADPKKYDSPLVFSHNNRIYLIGRRNLTETGNYDLGLDDLSHADQYLQNQVDYWINPKRCSLWEVSPDTLEVELLQDLPSRGDTCFASTVQLDPDAYLVFNYSSPIDGPEIGWSEGQNGPTGIYQLTLRLP